MDQTSTKVVVSSATLTSASLNLVLKNTGNATADVQTVIITPIQGNASAMASLPASLTGSAVFTLSSSGSLQPSNTLQGVALLSSVGAQVSASTSTTLGYTGLISLRIRPEEHPGNHRNRLGTAVPHHLHGCKHLHFHDSGGSIELHSPLFFSKFSLFSLERPFQEGSL